MSCGSSSILKRICAAAPVYIAHSFPGYAENTSKKDGYKNDRDWMLDSSYFAKQVQDKSYIKQTAPLFIGPSKQEYVTVIMEPETEQMQAQKETALPYNLLFVKKGPNLERMAILLTSLIAGEKSKLENELSTSARN